MQWVGGPENSKYLYLERGYLKASNHNESTIISEQCTIDEKESESNSSSLFEQMMNSSSIGNDSMELDD